VPCAPAGVECHAQVEVVTASLLGVRAGTDWMSFWRAWDAHACVCDSLCAQLHLVCWCGDVCMVPSGVNTPLYG
jgi:hypothetical protein